MLDDDQRHSLGPAADHWEYLYLSRRDWRERVIAKCGYRWKSLFTSAAVERHQQDQDAAIEAVLNELGDQGWELVGLVPINLTIFASGGFIGADAIFKRRKCQPDPAAELESECSGASVTSFKNSGSS
jgi:hypothetical protein